MYIEPRFNHHELYYGPYLMVNGQYVSHGSVAGDRILELFDWQPYYIIQPLVEPYCYWGIFTAWLLNTYPIGLWVYDIDLGRYFKFRWRLFS